MGKWPRVPATLAFALYLSLVPTAARAATDCLACHGEKEFKDASGRSIHVDADKQKASVHGILACSDCHSDIKDYPHPQHPQRVTCGTCHAEEAAASVKGIHSVLGAQACTSCHGEPHEVQPAAEVMPNHCRSCHTNEVRDYELSVHAFARKEGDRQGAICSSCHGPIHRALPASDPESSVAKRNLANTCGACHSNPEFLARHEIPYAHPVEAYRLSVHGRSLAAGNPDAASCSNCHGNHAIFPARDERSKINHWNVPATCGVCHTEIAKTYWESVHGQAVRNGAAQAPVCTDCHGEHRILAPNEPQSLVNPARLSTATCGRCHADERLARKYNLPLDKVPAYQDSYHGLALREGSQTVANCASCHGVHNIFPSSDPRSTVNPANLAHTCGNCHPGAGTAFAIGPVHVLPASASEHPVVKWIRRMYWILIPLAIAFMLFHNAADFLAKLVRHAPRVETGKQVPRMNLHFRIEHWLVVVSFPVLAITGFALKFPDAWWARPILLWESQFAFRGMLHRTAAVVLIGALVYHVVHLAVSRRDRVILRYMLPGIRDLRDFGDVILYNLGLSNQPPHFGKFSYAEKVEYLAFLWGMAIMTPTGFLLWFNNFTLGHFPKWVADAATALHYYEAILATLAILIWHFYMTVLDPDVYPMDLAWLTGKASADHLRHTRPAYYREILDKEKASENEAQKSSDAPVSPKDSA
jgi:cytochrome b subunit of formate dehydrogenase